MLPVNRLDVATLYVIALISAMFVPATHAGESSPRANQLNSTPLGKLKSRSATERWNNLNNSWRKTRARTASATETVVGASSSKQVPARLDNEPPNVRPIFGSQDDASIARLQDQPAEEQATEPEDEYKAPEFRKIGEIQPYFDYAPPNDLLPDEGPCAYLCPRPDGKPCLTPEGERVPACPQELQLSDTAYEPRMLPESVFSWEASNLFHEPLYFEDPALERYGHTLHPMIQPFASTARFGVQFLGLPYAATIDPYWKKRYTLGWYRPGECAPHKHYQIPLNADAAVYTAAVYTGLFYIFP